MCLRTNKVTSVQLPRFSLNPLLFSSFETHACRPWVCSGSGLHSGRDSSHGTAGAIRNWRQATLDGTTETTADVSVRKESVRLWGVNFFLFLLDLEQVWDQWNWKLFFLSFEKYSRKYVDKKKEIVYVYSAPESVNTSAVYTFVATRVNWVFIWNWKINNRFLRSKLHAAWPKVIQNANSYISLSLRLSSSLVHSMPTSSRCLHWKEGIQL